MEHKEYKSINKSVRKKDAMQLLLGKPVYTNDVTPDNALVVKILRSPHANAIVESINTAAAKKVPGVVDIYTWEDVPSTRFAIAGQTYPEPSPYDRLIIDRHVRFVGDVVAIIAFGFGKKTVKRLRLNIRSMSNVDLVAKHRYMEPKRSVEDMVFLDSWGNSHGLDKYLGFFDDMLWEAIYAASLAPSYLNRQAYGFLLKDGEISCEYQYGISNEVLPGQTAQVSVDCGRLLLIKVW